MRLFEKNILIRGLLLSLAFTLFGGAQACKLDSNPPNSKVPSKDRVHIEEAVVITPRTVLRKLIKSEDYLDLLAIQSDSDVVKMSGSPFHLRSFESSFDQEPYGWNHSGWDSIMLGIISLEENKLIGSIQLYRAMWMPTISQIAFGLNRPRTSWVGIGYSLSKSYWGKGIMTEVLQALVRHSFEEFDVQCFYAETLGTNQGSQRVLLKSGFEKLGERHAYYDFQVRPHAYFYKKKNFRARCANFSDQLKPQGDR